MITTSNQFIVIQKFMVEKLHLSGNELIIYAIIFGFSQDEATRFKGSQQYLADWCGISTRQVRTILTSLEDKGLINKNEKFYNKQKFNSYAVNFLPQEKTSYPAENSSYPQEISSYNNIDNNIDIDIFNNNDNNSRKLDVHRKKFGMYGRILLTLEQYDKLIEDFGKDFIDKQIDLLDEYVESNNNKNKYKDFNLVLRRSIRDNWFRRNDKKNDFVSTDSKVFTKDRF